MLLRYEPLNKQTHNKTFINITNFSEILQVCCIFLAEGEGFEPPVPFGTMVFKTTAIDHSANPPIICCTGETRTHVG